MITRRSLLGLPAGLLSFHALARSVDPGWLFQYPMGLPDRVPGDGCYVMHGYAVENAEFFPGLWHTGENWYVLQADAAGALVYAVADGEVVFAGYDYPGSVVIIKHADDLYSQYGHLNYELNVEVGHQVARGHLLGTILPREAPRSHLHFELRTFLIQPEVNGDSPRYSFNCGVNCPPGPGYWPMDAPEHPSAMGWRNPLHVITRRMGVPPGAEVMVPPESWNRLFLFSEPFGPIHSESLLVNGGTRMPLLAAIAGEEASTTFGAAATSVWYQVQVPGIDGPRWCPAISPTMHAIQSNGQTTSFVFNLIPVL
jgi:hypothetical protein